MWITVELIIKNTVKHEIISLKVKMFLKVKISVSKRLFPKSEFHQNFYFSNNDADNNGSCSNELTVIDNEIFP